MRATVTNAGLSDARNAIITAVVPASITLNAGSVVASLPGKVMTTTGAIIWQGDIPRGQTLVMNFNGGLPPISPKMMQVWLQATALADDQQGRLTQSSITLAPYTSRIFYPFIPVEAK
jgi:hypothetical protein